MKPISIRSHKHKTFISVTNTRRFFTRAHSAPQILTLWLPKGTSVKSRCHSQGCPRSANNCCKTLVHPVSAQNVSGCFSSGLQPGGSTAIPAYSYPILYPSFLPFLSLHFPLVVLVLVIPYRRVSPPPIFGPVS